MANGKNNNPEITISGNNEDKGFFAGMSFDPNTRLSSDADTQFEDRTKFDQGLSRYTVSQEDLRFQNQSAASMWLNAAGQAAAEIGLGTLEGMGYLLDLPQYYNYVRGAETEFSNWFSDLMKQTKEAYAESAPVFQSAEARESQFAPWDASWWASNLPSIASSVSLMLPAMGAAGFVGRIGRSLGTAARIAKGAGTAAEGAKRVAEANAITAAMFSRYMENTMNANEIAQSEFQALIEKGVPEQQARLEAGKAASRAFTASWALAIPDALQYGMIFSKGLKNLTKAATKQTKFGKAVDKIKNLAYQGITEGAEEGFQYGVGKEAARSSNPLEVYARMGMNLGEYFEDPEFLSSVALGAAGGMGMHVLGGLGRKSASTGDRMASVTDASIFKMKDLLQKKEAAKKKIADGDLVGGREIIDEVETDAIIENRNKYEQMVEEAIARGEDVTAMQDKLNYHDQIELEAQKIADKTGQPVEEIMKALHRGRFYESFVPELEQEALELVGKQTNNYTKEQFDWEVQNIINKKKDAPDALKKSKEEMGERTPLLPSSERGRFMNLAENVAAAKINGYNWNKRLAEMQNDPDKAKKVVQDQASEQAKIEKQNTQKAQQLVQDRLNSSVSDIRQNAERKETSEDDFEKTKLDEAITRRLSTLEQAADNPAVKKRIDSEIREEGQLLPDPQEFDNKDDYISAVRETNSPFVNHFVSDKQLERVYNKRKGEQSVSFPENTMVSLDGEQVYYRGKENNEHVFDTKDGEIRLTDDEAATRVSTDEKQEPIPVEPEQEEQQRDATQEPPTSVSQDFGVGSIVKLNTKTGGIGVIESETDTQYKVRVNGQLRSVNKENVEEYTPELHREYPWMPSVLPNVDAEYVPVKPEYEGKIVYATPGSGKSMLAEQAGNIIDADDVLYHLLREVDDSVTWNNFRSKIIEHHHLREEFIERLQTLANTGFTVLTGNSWAMDAADVYIVQRNESSIAKALQSKKRKHQVDAKQAKKDAKNLTAREERKIREATFELGPDQFLSDVLVNKAPRLSTQQLKGWKGHTHDKFVYQEGGKWKTTDNDWTEDMVYAYMDTPSSAGRAKTRNFIRTIGRKVDWKNVPIYYEVDPYNPWNKDTAKRKVSEKTLGITATIYYQGERYNIAMVPSDNTKNNIPPYLKKLRKEMWEKFQNSDGKTILRADNEGRITHVDWGFPNMTENKPPSQVLSEFQQNQLGRKGSFFMGIAISDTQVVTNGKLPPVQVIPGEKKTPGQPYMLIQSPHGLWGWGKLKLKKLSEVPRLEREVRSIIEKAAQAYDEFRQGKMDGAVADWRKNYREYQNKVQQIVTYKDRKTGKYKPVFNSEMFRMKVLIKDGKFDVDKIMAVLRSKNLNIDKRQINQGKYNQLVDERMYTNTATGVQFHSPRFTFTPYEDRTESNTDFTISKDDFRFSTASPERSVTGRINQDEAIAELQKILPKGTPIRFIEGLLFKDSLDAVAMAHDAAVDISNEAPDGEHFHEAFHIIFGNSLTNEQRRTILQQAEQEFGLTEREIEVAQERLDKLREEKDENGRPKYYIDTTARELALEEKLADKFRDHMMGLRNPKHSSWLKKLLNDLAEWVKTLLSFRSPIEKLFRDIQRGRFVERTTYNRRYAPRLSASRLSNKDVLQLRSSLLVILDTILETTENKDGLPKFDMNNMARVYRKALSKKLENNYISSVTQRSLLTGLANYQWNHPMETNKQDFLTVMKEIRQDIVDFGYNPQTKKIEIRTEGTPKRGPLYDELVLALVTRGVNIRTKTDVATFAKDTEIEEVVDTRANWQRTVSISAMESLSSRVRAMLNSIPRIRSGKPVMDMLGFVTYLDPRHAYSHVQAIIGGSPDVHTMLARLERVMEHDDIARHAFELLTKEGSMGTKYQSVLKDSVTYQYKEPLATQLLHNVGQKAHPSYYVILEKHNRWDLALSNRFTRRMTVQAELMDSFSFFDKADEKARKSYEALYKKRDEYKTRFLLQNTFPSIPTDVLNKATEDVQLRKLYFSSLDSYTRKDSDTKGNFERSFREFIEQIEKYYEVSYQSGHLDVNGKKVYEWINSSYIARLLQKSQTGRMLPENDDVMFQDLLIPDQNVELVYTDGIKYGKSYLEVENPTEREAERGWVQDRKGRKYDKFSERDTLNSMLAYFTGALAGDSNKEGKQRKRVIIPFPVLSDAPAQVGLMVDKITKREAVERLKKLREKEQARMKENFFDMKKTRLNEAVFFVDKDGKTVDSVVGFGNVLLNDLLNKLVEVEIISIDGEYNPSELAKSLARKQVKIKNSKFTYDQISEFLWNYMYYHSELILIGTGDPAFYKDNKDYYKRAKELYSPGNFGNVDAVVDIKDRFFGNDQIQIIGVGGTKNMVWNVNPDVKKNTSKIFNEDSDLTDGQTFIDPLGMRNRELLIRGWSEQQQTDFEILMRGELPARYKRDFTQTSYKPFIFFQRVVGSKLVPTQKKDSESMIAPFYGREYVNGKKNDYYNPEYKRILEGMGFSFETTGNNTKVKFDLNKRQYDVYTHESAVKVGYITGQDIIVPYEQWRLQQETPAHHDDTDGIFGTQLMKLVVSNIAKDEPYVAPSDRYPEGLNGKEAYDEFNRLLVKKIIASMPEVNEQKLRDMVAEQMISNNVTGDAIAAIYELPLWHPYHGRSVQNILSSIYRKAVTRQRMSAAGSLVNVSGLGFDDNLRIVRDDKGGVQYFEAMIPMHNKALLDYVDSNLGYITKETLNKPESEGGVPEHLKQAIGYRIPTEGKYSMFPIRVVGFLPAGEGSIILPTEVTKIAGLDFDIDKMFLFFKNGEDTHTDERKKTDDELFDLMYAILQHPNTAVDMLVPGGFDVITEVTKKFPEPSDPVLLSPVDYVTTQQRVQAGMDLIGVYAVGNASHAIVQHYEVELGGSFNFKLDPERILLPDMGYIEEEEGKPSRVSFSTLSNEYNVAGEQIGKLLASRIHMAADNAKNPQAERYNANLYTSDVEVAMLQAGVPNETVMVFMRQPAIVEWVKEFYNRGGDFDTEQQMVAERFEKPPSKKMKVAYLAEWKLWQQIENPDEDYQRMVLQNFLIYKAKAAEVSKLNRAIMVADRGAGPTVAETYYKIQTVMDAVDSDFLAGHEEILLGDDTYTNTLIEQGVQKVYQQMIQLGGFPNIFSYNILEYLRLSTEISGRSPSLFIVQKLYDDALVWAATQHPFYAKEPSKNLAVKVQEAKAEYPDNPFLNRLRANTKKGEITFTNPYTNDAGELGILKDSFSELYEQDPDLVKDLARYAFRKNGFSPGKDGFSHILPKKLFDDLPDLTNIMESAIRGISYDHYLATDFLTQFQKVNYMVSPSVPNAGKALTVVDGVGYLDVEALALHSGGSMVLPMYVRVDKKLYERVELNYYIAIEAPENYEQAKNKPVEGKTPVDNANIGDLKLSSSDESTKLQEQRIEEETVALWEEYKDILQEKTSTTEESFRKAVDKHGLDFIRERLKNCYGK